MQSIGINKCKIKNLKYYDIISKNLGLDIGTLDVEKISSVIINTSIENMDYIKNISSIKVFINISLRIIYSKCDDKSLYVYDKNIVEVSYIEVDNFLDGNNTNLTFIKNKIKCEMFTENLSYKLIDQNLLSVNYIILINLKINPTFCIAYCINNNFFDNIFLSYNDGKNLTQQTFSMDLNYSNILWQYKGSNIVFIGYKEDLYYINILDYNSKSQSKVSSISSSNPINGFCFYKTNNIILSMKENNNDFLYILNLKQKNLKRFNVPNISYSYKKPYYYESMNTLFILCKLEEIYCLCSLDKNNTLDILFNFASVEDYYVCQQLNSILVHVIKSNQSFFYTIDIDSKNLNTINFNFKYDKIIKFKYIINKNLEENILILIKYESKTYLYSYNIHTFSSNIIYSDDFIVDFDININSQDIYIVKSNNIISEVIKISLYDQTEILKIPSAIKSISVK